MISPNYMTIDIKGMEGLNERLRKLSLDLQYKGLDQATKAGARLMRDEVKKHCPVKTGNLKKSIVMRKMTKKNVVPVVYHITNNRNRSRGADGWYAHIVEFGSIKHPAGWELDVRPRPVRRNKRGRKRRERKKVMVMYSGGLGTREVLGTHFWHRRIKAQPFFRKAWELKKHEALDRIAKNLRKFIEKKETALSESL